MEQQLKERLVGASVLVAIGMLVIPALLDGPDPSSPVKVGLAGPGDDGREKTHQIRLDVPKESRETPSSGRISRATGDPVTTPARLPSPQPAEQARARPEENEAEQASPEPSSQQPSSQQQTRVVSVDGRPTGAPSTAPARPAKAPPVAASPAPAGSWSVQVGSFSRKENAERLAGDLRSKGYEVSVSRVDRAGGAMHRVRVGPVADREAAVALAGRLKAAGQSGTVVPNEG